MSFLTNIASAFKGGGQSRVPLARSFTSPWTFAVEPGGGRLPFDYSRAVRHAYLENPVAQRAVRLVAEGVAGAPLAGDVKLLALLGATSAGQALLETLAAQLLLHGNGFVQVMKDAAGQPVELFALRPERVSVVPDAAGWPAAYQYKVGDKVLTIPIEDEAGWPNLIHLKSFHPADDHERTGDSLSRRLAACRTARGTHRRRYRGYRGTRGYSRTGRCTAYRRCVRIRVIPGAKARPGRYNA